MQVRLLATGIEEVRQEAVALSKKFRNELLATIAAAYAPVLQAQVERNLSGEVLDRKSSKLFNSLKWYVYAPGGAHAGEIRLTFVDYGNVHETGATPLVSSKKLMSIPLNGSPKGGLKSFTNTFLKYREGGYTVFKRYSKAPGDFMPIYLLLRSVDIPKRSWYMSAIEKTEPDLQRIIEETVNHISGGY